MTRRVYLHVGAPKTGTTYLQDRLALNRQELARHDVHYPLGLHASHFKAALDLLDLSWGGQREGARGEWAKLVDRVNRHDGTVIVSHEILAGARPAQIRRAMEDLGSAEVTKAKPQRSASSTATRASGARSSRCHAVHSPR